MSTAVHGTGERLVEFVQYDIPPLKNGEYEATVTQTVEHPAKETFTAKRRFAVGGERFSIDPAEIAGVFPPDLAEGEYAGVLPHVVLNRRTLPWQRASVASEVTAPWLAVLLFDDDQAPAPVQRTAADLVPAGEKITVAGSAETETGAMPAGVVSYPGLKQLQYGERPSEPCTTIDVPAGVFAAVAPSAADLPYLAHIRRADTVDAQDDPEPVSEVAIVLCNRAGAVGSRSHAFLVSLENLGPRLPGGTEPPAADEQVRLVVFRAWTFTADAGAEHLRRLLEELNGGGAAAVPTTLQVPLARPAPDRAEVEAALAAQAQGALDQATAGVLVANALGLGYLPLPHHLRHGGETVSWYRGPLAPLAVEASVGLTVSCPDAANRYDPQTGMFDVSYGAAWQLGQLLALRNRGFATALYEWRRRQRLTAAARAEQERLAELAGGTFAALFAARAEALGTDPPQPPAAVLRWLARLRLLHGVPFNYLVPDEAMLPRESLRFFHLDLAWIDALAAGALSIGRAVAGEGGGREDAAALRQAALAASRDLRPNPAPLGATRSASGDVTGFLLRSAAVAGWPALHAKGYSDSAAETEIGKLRFERLSREVIVCLFEGVVRVAALREAPEQVHCGFEVETGTPSTTLREVSGAKPGEQTKATAAVPVRADGRTIEAAAAAASIEAGLKDKPGPPRVTAAEFALEMIKGVVEVEFRSS
jgi:hypothetical protein